MRSDRKRKNKQYLELLNCVFLDLNPTFLRVEKVSSLGTNLQMSPSGPIDMANVEEASERQMDTSHHPPSRITILPMQIARTASRSPTQLI